MIRVLIVDDSPFMRRAITRILMATPDIEVAGVAGSGKEALDMIAAVAPDVITLDVVMPGEDGLSVLERVMSTQPTPTLMLSSVTTENADYTLSALEAGAVDFLTKPTGFTHMNMSRIGEELIDKIRTAAQVDVGMLSVERRNSPASTPKPDNAPYEGPAYDAFVVGSSTGGPAALKVLLRRLPADFAAAMLVVQHMPLGFTAALAGRLDSITLVPVVEARDGDLFEGGRVLIAPSGTQAHIVSRRGRRVIALDRNPPDTIHIPSVDVTMFSAARTLGADATGILLTGMGMDGARGLKQMREAGAYTIAESESTAVVWGMPRVAVELDAACEVAPLPEIAEMIVRRAARVANPGAPHGQG